MKPLLTSRETMIFTFFFFFFFFWEEFVFISNTARIKIYKEVICHCALVAWTQSCVLFFNVNPWTQFYNKNYLGFYSKSDINFLEAELYILKFYYCFNEFGADNISISE